MCPEGNRPSSGSNPSAGIAEYAPIDGAAWDEAQTILNRLYGKAGDGELDPLFADIAARIAAARAGRSPELKALDAARAGDAQWFVRPGRPAYCTYVDRLGGTLRGCAARIPYLAELNVGLFHPLPLLKCREGDSDGGFAVSDYRDVEPRLGTFDDLVALAADLRKADISLVLDVVCNHTAREHPWAQGFLAGDPAWRDFYIRLGSETDVAEWSAPLNQVFPDTAPGNFTHVPEAGGWLWTTFYPFQWDLNYANPRVFVEMLDVLLHLANAGAEGFRLDSAAYLWKAKGTSCRNLPQAHDILRALKLLVSIAAPSVFFLAEAIEDIDEVIPFFGAGADARECDLAYNNTPMTALWASLAEGDSDMFAQALTKASARPDHGAWLNYVRCHDDIIWPAVNALAPASRQTAWSRFFDGETFARGAAFQAPAGCAPSTCGMAASLCGVEDGKDGVERLKSLYTLIFALDGVPMIYMGDEIALTNDEGFRDDPQRAAELRWLNRPAMDWQKADRRHAPDGLEAEVFAHFVTLGSVLRRRPELAAAGPARPLPAPPAIAALVRETVGGVFIAAANLTAEPKTLDLDHDTHNLLTGEACGRRCELAPWQAVWLVGEA
jgi:amylosucrase